MGDTPAEIARTWLKAWDTGDLNLPRPDRGLRPHQRLQPYRRRDESLRIVEPRSKVSTVGITVRDMIEDNDRAVIAYELESADTAVGTKKAGDSDYGRRL